jgi:hypothetical protein
MGLGRSLALVTEHGPLERLFPSLQCSHINLEYLTGPETASASRHRFFNQLN